MLPKVFSNRHGNSKMFAVCSSPPILSHSKWVCSSGEISKDVLLRCPNLVWQLAFRSGQLDASSPALKFESIALVNKHDAIYAAKVIIGDIHDLATVSLVWWSRSSTSHDGAYIYKSVWLYASHTNSSECKFHAHVVLREVSMRQSVIVAPGLVLLRIPLWGGWIVHYHEDAALKLVCEMFYQLDR